MSSRCYICNKPLHDSEIKYDKEYNNIYILYKDREIINEAISFLEFNNQYSSKLSVEELKEYVLVPYLVDIEMIQEPCRRCKSISHQDNDDLTIPLVHRNSIKSEEIISQNGKGYYFELFDPLDGFKSIET